MPEGDPTANSTEAQAAVTAALDSVTVIDNIIDNTEAVAGQTTAEKADDADRNYRHIELMKEKDWFWNTATIAQKTKFTTAITEGKTYYQSNSAA